MPCLSYIVHTLLVNEYELNAPVSTFASKEVVDAVTVVVASSPSIEEVKYPAFLQILRSRLIETLNVRDGYRPAVSRYTGCCTQARDRAVERCDPAECRASMFE